MNACELLEREGINLNTSWFAYNVKYTVNVDTHQYAKN